MPTATEQPGAAVSTPVPQAEPALAPGSLTPADLAELITSFNDITGKLEATHAQLRAEVHRLNDELRQANERLRRSERLAELGEMAAGIAHEIRNPLGSISLYSEMLAGDLAATGEAGEDSPCATARKIGAAVRRLDAIVRDVLDFARDVRVHPESIEPGELFDAAIESPRAGDWHPDGRDETGEHSPGFVRLDLSDDAPREVWCDRSLGLQALLNVIENARQAMAGSPGGSITLDCRRVTLRGGGGAPIPGVAMIVRDEGPGIEPGVLERMFNPFFTTRKAGTGLGLAIVHRIVDAHGGSVVVRNNSETDRAARGATVELRFPDFVAGADHITGRPGRRQETEQQG